MSKTGTFHVISGLYSIGLHGADFQFKFRPKVVKLDQNPFHPKVKKYVMGRHPNPYQRNNCFYLYSIKILAVLISNVSYLAHVSQ